MRAKTFNLYLILNSSNSNIENLTIVTSDKNITIGSDSVFSDFLPSDIDIYVRVENSSQYSSNRSTIYISENYEPSERKRVKP